MFTRYIKIVDGKKVVNLSSEAWGLYCDEPGTKRAARALNTAMNKIINRKKRDDNKFRYEMETVMGKYAQQGADDSEPRGIALDIYEEAYDLRYGDVSL